jgi:hypothetical protein
MVIGLLCPRKYKRFYKKNFSDNFSPLYEKRVDLPLLAEKLWRTLHFLLEKVVQLQSVIRHTL